ncbi:MAG: GNAT family N-acetyltransferase [Parashewanella sp.]
MDCKISLQKQQDILSVAKLFDEYRQFYHQESDLELAKNFIEARFNEQSSFVLYAKDSMGIPLGFAQLFPSFSSVRAQPILILNDLFVAQHARCFGVGRALIDECKQFAKRNGYVAISLKTHVENERAQALYEGLDFKRVDDFLTFNCRL